MLSIRSLPTGEVPPAQLAAIRSLLDATLPHRQGQCFGTLAMQPITEHIRRADELGMLGTGAHRFYERLGWERWQGPSFVRRAGGFVDRTLHDDDGLMVFRTGPSATIDLSGPVTCQDRPGDCW